MGNHIFINSPRVDKIHFENKNLFIFRDDLIHPILNGNKARKLFFYLNNQINYHTIISYGGNQSNMLLALSYFCFIKKIKFIYYTTSIPSHIDLKDMTKKDNLHFAIEHNTKIIQIEKDKFQEKIVSVKNNVKKYELFINQGAKETFSQYGIKKQACFIMNYFLKNNINDIDIFIPSGTGTSAFYLRKFIQKDINIYTTSCIGDESYLKQQFTQLQENKKILTPTILNTNKKYHFGKCYKEFALLYKEVTKSNIDFDLLYDMKSLLCIKENTHKLKKNILYIHCGGIYANASMKERYNYKFNANLL